MFGMLYDCRNGLLRKEFTRSEFRMHVIKNTQHNSELIQNFKSVQFLQNVTKLVRNILNFVSEIMNDMT